MTLLATLGLTPAAIAARRASIGGSDANTIMGGNAERINRMWQEKRGEIDAEDLSGNLAVQMGSYTEPLNAAWFEKQTGIAVTMRGDVARRAWSGHPMTATIDGMAGGALWEAKHTNNRDADAAIFERYVPQLTHNCLCIGVGSAYLSVFKGNGDWCMFEYELDADYAAAVVEAEAAFWQCVTDGTAPHPFPSPPAPKPVGVVEYDMATSNAWCSYAAEYVETQIAAQRHDAAKAAIKELVPDDASKAFGAGIVAKRDKRGAIRITMERE